MKTFKAIMLLVVALCVTFWAFEPIVINISNGVAQAIAVFVIFLDILAISNIVFLPQELENDRERDAREAMDKAWRQWELLNQHNK